MADDANVLDKARSLIEERLKELDDERKRLEKALAQPQGRAAGARPPARLTLDRRAAAAGVAAAAAAPAPTTPSRRSRNSRASAPRRSPRS